MAMVYCEVSVKNYPDTERGTTMRNEVVYSYLDDRHALAKRQSNRTLLVDKRKLVDSDKAIITDKFGHRYARSVHLETYSGEHFVFEMI